MEITRRLQRVVASRCFRLFFYYLPRSDLWRPPPSAAAHALRAGRRRGAFWAARRLLRCVFEFWFIVNALNCASYGEPDVRPAGRPTGACAAIRIAAAVCVASYCASVRPAVWPVAESRKGGCGQRPTGAVRSVPRGSANRVPRRRGRRLDRPFGRLGIANNSDIIERKYPRRQIPRRIAHPNSTAQS